VKTNFGMIDIIRSLSGGNAVQAPPAQQDMDYTALASAPPPPSSQSLLPRGAPGGVQPWDVGRGDIYNAQATQAAPMLFAPPESMNLSADEKAMVTERQNVLRDWGQRRERTMHRAPRCLMDQMLSGSGLYPVRLLEDRWFTEREKAMVLQLEQLLQPTGHQRDLARDMLAPMMYDIDKRIILDNSGSMQLDMFGQTVNENYSRGGFQCDAKSYQNSNI